jgi:hypothetical protein
MQTTIKLKNPIKVDGKEVKELPFNTDVFTLEELQRANKKVAKLKEITYVMELDPDYQFIVASLIVEKTSKNKISSEDLSRLKGTDLFALTREGRNFLLESDEEVQENTVEQSEPIAESTEQE